MDQPNDRNLPLELVRVTEAAALMAARSIRAHAGALNRGIELAKPMCVDEGNARW